MALPRKIPSRIPSRLAAGLGAIGLAAGLAITGAGPAQAAVPDKWGFAFIDKPTVAGIPDLSHQAGTWPALMHAHSAPGVPGQVIVRFPAIAAKGGVVHVTAVNVGAVWCQAQKWGPSGTSEMVTVRCFKAGGVPVFSQFTVLFTVSSKGKFPAGRAYGYVHFEPGPGIVTSFNSAGSANTVAPGPTGVWTVKMPGLGSAAPAGQIQVTAVNSSGPAKCGVGGWSSTPGGQAFQVRCFNGGSTPLKTGWTLSYERRRAITGAQPKFFAYTFDDKPLLPGPYAPAPAGVNFNSQGAVNTIRSAGTGLRLVQFPRVGKLPNTVLVTPFHAGPAFCNLLAPWATAVPNVIVRDVACYTAAGTLKNERTMTTYTSAH
jgi:hypothetical protein